MGIEQMIHEQSSYRTDLESAVKRTRRIDQLQDWRIVYRTQDIAEANSRQRDDAHLIVNAYLADHDRDEDEIDEPLLLASGWTLSLDGTKYTHETDDVYIRLDAPNREWQLVAFETEVYVVVLASVADLRAVHRLFGLPTGVAFPQAAAKAD